MAAVNAMMVMQMIGINPLGKSKGAATANRRFGTNNSWNGSKNRPMC